MELRNIRLKICLRNTCAQFPFEHLRLSVRDLLTRLMTMYELAYCVPWGGGGGGGTAVYGPYRYVPL